MKTILVIALLVAMLVVPSAVANPGGVPNDNAIYNNPNGNPAAFFSFIVTFYGDTPNGPGFSEAGQDIASWAQNPDREGGVLGVSQFAPNPPTI